MLAAYGSCAIIFIASSALGQAIRAVCGVTRWTWTAPAVGFAALLTVTGAAIRLPGGGWTSLGVVCALLVVSALIVFRTGLGVGLGSLLLTTGPIVVIVAALASGNYIINEGFGIPGVSQLNDFAGHLPWAEALSTHDSPFSLIIPGYPLGPFALAGTLGKVPGLSVLPGFQGILIATPVLIAVTTMALFERLPTVLRITAATIVSLAYLITSALAEGAFKEPIEALFVVAVALLLRELAQRPERRPYAVAVPVAVVIAGSVANYSYPGLSWPLLIVALWMLLELARRRRSISRPMVNRAVAAVLIGTATLILLALPEIARFHAFQQAQVSTIDAQTGNVPTMIPWRETLGIWFSDDFRLWQTQSLDLQHALLIFALLVLLIGVVQAWRRRESSLLALLGAAVVVAVYARDTANAYNAAKAMMVLSCAVVLLMICGILPAGRWSERSSARQLQLAGVLMAVLFAAACLWSDGLALRGSQVGPTSHSRELERLRPMLEGHTVLFLPQDDFAAWELRGTRLGYLTLYDIPSLPVAMRSGKPFVIGEPADFNSVTTHTLNAFRYVVTTTSKLAGVPPPNWRPVASTRSYQVWKRTRVTAPYSTLPVGPAPGGTLDCSTRSGRTLSRTGGRALVSAPPVVLDGGGWQGPVLSRQPGMSVLSAGTTVNQRVIVPPGRWQVSVQYVSSTPLVIHAGGLRSALPAALEHLGPYWSAGQFTSSGGPITIGVAAQHPPPLATGRSAMLGDVGLVRVDVAPRLVPLNSACGRYVNWYD